MTDLSALGLICFGIVLTLAVLGGFVLWVTRGFRVDLSGVKFVRKEDWAGPSVTPMPYTFRVGDPPSGRWNPMPLPDDSEETGDSERPPVVQHGSPTRGSDG